MRRVLLLSLLIIFAISTAAAAKTWTIYEPVWVGGGTGPTVTLSGLGPDGHDAWWRGNPADDWAQAWYTFDFADMVAGANYTVEYFCPETPDGYAVGWGPITWASGAKWGAADMSSRAGAWLPVGDLGFGATIQKGDALFYKWNPWGGGYSNVASAVRVTGPAVPEPCSLLALAAGFPVLALLRRKH